MILKFTRKMSWRVWAIVAILATGGLVAGLALTTGQSARALPAQTAVINKPAHQLAELNFLLGSFTCSTTAKNTISETTHKVLYDTYYQMNISGNISGKGQLSATWTLGWNAIDHNFIAQYFDNSGITGTATSAGWKNGQLTLPGQYLIVADSGGSKGVGKGYTATSKDVFRIVGKNHYTDDSYILRNGNWVAQGTDDCQRSVG